MRKKIGRKATLTALVVALALATTLPGTTAQAKGKVAMNKAKVTVCTGKSYTLKMSGISKKVKWSTSDKNVVSITKKSGKKAEKVTIKGNKKGTATVTAKVGKKKYKATVKVAGHKYGKVTYKWNKDYSKCTASKKCSRCGKTLKQTVKTTNKTTKATCTETGKKKYTAQFSKYSFGTKTKSVTIKVKGHKVNSDKKISYKWNSGYSKCTATYYCKNGGEKQKESVKVNKQTTPATKTSKGKVVYTATFKTKGLQAQTKKVTIPKLAYLTLNGKEVDSVTVRSDRPVTVTVHNATIDGLGISTNNNVFPETTASFKDNQVTISTKDKIANVENVTATIWTQNGQRVDCAIKVMFTPGEYNFGEIGTLPTGGYRGYGKQKGTYGNDGYYIMDCNTKKDYDDAYRFYHERKDRNGSICDLEQKTADIYSDCNKRADYKSKFNQDIQSKAVEAGYSKYYYTNYVDEKCDEALRNYFYLFTNSDGSFREQITSNAQVKQIVTAWANEYNGGQMPSWYYPTVFSDWAEWSGRDTNAGIYNECPVLPDNFRD